MNIADLINRSLPPTNWDAWSKIPWHEPAFSERMLQSHLSQEHDWASRTKGVIEKQTAFICRALPPAARVLDLGCGPGLYAERLHAAGHACTGVDFSPASIAYAKSRPAAGDIRYVLEDLREHQPAGAFDAALLLFGEINAFSREEALEILRKTAACLLPGGKAFIEVHTERAVREIGSQPSVWRSFQSGLFSAAPHLQLEEHFWNEERFAAMSRYYVLDAAKGGCEEFASLTQAYGDREYRELFRRAGFSQSRLTPGRHWPTGKAFAGKLRCFVCSA